MHGVLRKDTVVAAREFYSGSAIWILRGLPAWALILEGSCGPRRLWRLRRATPVGMATSVEPGWINRQRERKVFQASEIDEAENDSYH